MEDPSGLVETALGHRQVTDAHLVSLAIRQRGALATFDRGVVGIAVGYPESVLPTDGRGR